MQVNHVQRMGEEFSNTFSRAYTIKSKMENDVTENIKLPVKTITFQVTEQCSLACTYCYEINKRVKVMKLEDAKKFIDLLIEDSYKEDSYVYIGNVKAIVIEFIGGEPLLQIDLIHEILDYFIYRLTHDRHIWAINHMISIISNGVSYFNERTQDLFTKYGNRMSFSISLDGCKELHDACRVFHDGSGSYDIVEKACVDYLTNHDKYMSTKMTLAPENLSYIETAFENLLNLGYRIINANPIYEANWTIDQAKEYYIRLKNVADIMIDRGLYNSVKTTIFNTIQFQPLDESNNDNYCGSTGSMLALDSDGNIFPCIRFMSSSLGESIEPVVIGHVDTGIGRDPQYKKYINILDSITRRSQSEDKCFDCPIAGGCGWCTALNYQENGTVDKRLTNICNMHKARSLANVYYWNKIYKLENSDDIFKMHIPKEWALEIISEDEYNMLLELSK